MRYYSEQLAEYIEQLSFDNLPEAVVKQAKWCILDSIGVALASCQTPWAKSVLNIVRKMSGALEATVFYYGDKVPDMNAAMANAMFVHSMDYNDDLAGIQVGGIIPPTAIAVGESLKTSGKEVIAAVVLGYDIATRTAVAINSQELYLRGLQPTAVCGAFAAAAVAGKLLHLTPEQIAHAFGISASYAGGTIEFLKEGTDTKRFHVAKAAHGGILSAHLAQNGMTGPRSIFEGDFGVFKVYSRDPNPEQLVEELGIRYDILATSIKLYPFCDGNATPLEAVLSIVREHKIALKDIKKIHFRTKSFLIPYTVNYHGDTTRKYRPENEMDAQMSLPYCLAVGLLRDGDVRIEDFDPKNYTNAQILELADKVTAEGDPELDKIPLRPMSMPAIATLTTKNGQIFTKRVDYQKGDPRNPFSESDYLDKFSRCADGKLSNDKKARLLEALMNLEALPDISHLTQYVT